MKSLKRRKANKCLNVRVVKVDKNIDGPLTPGAL